MALGGYEGRLVAGRYRLVSLLGAGGFGAVWEARDEHLRVRVALKEVVLDRSGSQAERAERVKRAEREARHAAQLRNHPHVVAVHDVIVEDGTPWMVMELVAGGSLEQRLRTSGPLETDRAEQVAEAVLQALCAAHAAGIVHRDVKPANILLAEDGQILLADFGIAVHDDDTALTGTGLVIGSVEYMAPERAEGDDGGPPGDLFSLGATLYQAVEGFSPFRRSSASGSLRAVVSHDPAPVTASGRLAPLIARLLDKDPGSRPTAEQALRMLQAVEAPTSELTGQPESPDPPSRRPVGGALFAALCFAIGIAACLGIGFFPMEGDVAHPEGVVPMALVALFIVWAPIRISVIGLSEVIPDHVAVAVAKYGSVACCAIALVGGLSVGSIRGIW
ncbi:serine/threonine-protein kinase [Streptomyces roseus]|uniref:serine/threonine-protein kinase n=1 Tax=Streptomyces roseus TaxID=66430 RepID=UPI003405ACB4